MKFFALVDPLTRSIRNSLAAGCPINSLTAAVRCCRWVGRQFVVLFLVLLFFDDPPGFVIGVLHVIFELLHLTIEVIEHFTEEMLEHTLHTDHHQSETIIVNAVLLIALYGLYRSYRAWPRL
ncbi:MAG: hypothetical protein ACXW03_10360 [Methylobacter sp.]